MGTELLGREVRCPLCQGVTTAPATGLEETLLADQPPSGEGSLSYAVRAPSTTLTDIFGPSSGGSEPVRSAAAAPAGVGAEAPPTAPRETPRRLSLPVSAWLLALLTPYAIAATALAVFLFMRGGDRPIHPLESLADQGVYEELQEGRRKEIVSPLEPLPPEAAPLSLGQTRRFGGLVVTPVDVTLRKLTYSYRGGEEDLESDERSLALRLRLKNVSSVVFHPLDPTFNRSYRRESPSYTYLELGGSRFYGLARDALSERVLGQNFEELLPGKEMETLILATREAPPGQTLAEDAFARAPKEEPLVWRVQLRKGREEVVLKQSGQKRWVWATTIVPVTFTPAQVRLGG